MSAGISVSPPAEAATGGSRPRALPVRFVSLFVLYLLVGNACLTIPFVDSRLVEPWTKANGSATAGLTRLFGMESQASGMELASGSAILSVKKGCNGVEALIILASAILAFPAPWKRRLLGVVLGTVAIFGFNLVRLASLLLVAVHQPARLEFFHVYVWQTLIVLIAFGLFLLWGTFVARERPAS